MTATWYWRQWAVLLLVIPILANFLTLGVQGSYAHYPVKSWKRFPAIWDWVLYQIMLFEVGKLAIAT